MKTPLLIQPCCQAPSWWHPAPLRQSAPTPDVMIIQTSAAQTVVANFTLTAAAFTPTSQPVTDTQLLQRLRAAPRKHQPCFRAV